MQFKKQTDKIRVNFFLSQKVWQEIKDFSQQEDISSSSLLRKWIALGFEQHKKDYMGKADGILRQPVRGTNRNGLQCHGNPSCV